MEIRGTKPRIEMYGPIARVDAFVQSAADERNRIENARAADKGISESGLIDPKIRRQIQAQVRRDVYISESTESISIGSDGQRHIFGNEV